MAEHNSDALEKSGYDTENADRQRQQQRAQAKRHDRRLSCNRGIKHYIIEDLTVDKRE